MLEFKSFSKIPRLANLNIRITQKLNGTNGVIAITSIPTKNWTAINDPTFLMKVGSRNQWLPSPREIEEREKEIQDWKYYENCTTFKDCFNETPPKPKKLHDNHGFAKWAYEHQDALIEFLGEGYHYGEWCGPGIQNGEGLKERGFYLFSPRKRYFNDKRQPETIPEGLHFVPKLYDGSWDVTQYSWLRRLQMEGSKLVEGFPVEGLIIEVEGKLKIKVIINEAQKNERKRIQT